MLRLTNFSLHFFRILVCDYLLQSHNNRYTAAHIYRLTYLLLSCRYYCRETLFKTCKKYAKFSWYLLVSLKIFLESCPLSHIEKGHNPSLPFLCMSIIPWLWTIASLFSLILGALDRKALVRNNIFHIFCKC